MSATNVPMDRAQTPSFSRTVLRRILPSVKHVIVLLAVTASACSLTATMIPIEGPMSRLQPVPVIHARADGVYTGAGKVSFQMPDGDQCDGRWATAGAGGSVSTTNGTLISQYGTAVGMTTTIASGDNAVRGQGIITCGSGRIVELEFLTSTSGHGFGVAKDSRENVFKFVF